MNGAYRLIVNGMAWLSPPRLYFGPVGLSVNWITQKLWTDFIEIQFKVWPVIIIGADQRLFKEYDLRAFWPDELLTSFAKVNAVNHLYIKAIIRFGLSNHQTTQPDTPNFQNSLETCVLDNVTLMAYLAT